MVKVEADKIKETVLTEFADARTIDIIHSTGVVKAGEISLFVIVSAGHRQHAIKACSKAVELIKEKFRCGKRRYLKIIPTCGNNILSDLKQVPLLTGFL